MKDIPYAAALNLFAGWERQNKKVAVLGSNSGCVISLRDIRVTHCLDDQLQLACPEGGTLRFFLRGALFEAADPRDFPVDSRAWFAEYERGVQIRFVSLEMQCFIFPARDTVPD